MRFRFPLVSFAILAIAGSTVAQEKLPGGRTVAKIESKPASIALKNPFEFNQILLTATLDNGDAIDVTRIAKLEVPAIVKSTPNGLVRPVSDGSASIKATVGDKSIAIPVVVSGLKERYNVSFVKD